MVTCASCAVKNKCHKDLKCDLLKPKYGRIKHVVGVVSGKGGVGKSTITGVLAVQLKKMGYKVGVLDADITGPSMPRFFGLENEKTGYAPTDVEGVYKFLPLKTELGIKVISMNFMVEEEEPLLWKGPVLGSVTTQLYQDTDWGELDYLLIDLPPGTGDIALTIMQDFAIDYLVMVSNPQTMVSMIVSKMINMAKKLEIPIKGVVQNMSYIVCKNCNERMNVFSENSAQSQADKMGLKLLAELPIDTKFSDYMESGKAESFAATNPDYEVLYNAFKDDEKEIYERNAKTEKKFIPLI